LVNVAELLRIEETISICLSWGKPTTKSDSAVLPLGDLSKISLGLGKGCRELFVGDGAVWQIEQITGGVPLKNCCLWHEMHELCTGYSVMSGYALSPLLTLFQLLDGNLWQLAQSNRWAAVEWANSEYLGRRGTGVGRGVRIAARLGVGVGNIPATTLRGDGNKNREVDKNIGANTKPIIDRAVTFPSVIFIVQIYSQVSE
jgi:hypothetical protein